MTTHSLATRHSFGMNPDSDGYVTTSDLEVQMTTSVRIAVAAAAAALALVSACSSSKSGTSAGAEGSLPATSTGVTISSSAGTLVGPNGHTLYVNTVDTATTVSCTGACAQEWPPLVGDPVVGAGLNASDFATVARPDATTQVTFEGHPLYYFNGDNSPGSTAGNGMADQGGSWHVADSSPVSTTGGISSAPTTMSSSGSSGGTGSGSSSAGGYGY